MGKIHIGINDQFSTSPAKDVAEPVETIVYKTIETVKEVVKEVPVIQIQEVEKIVYVDRPVEVVKQIIQEVVKEVPVTVYEIKRVEVPVEKVVRVHDIDQIIAQKKLVFEKDKKINKLVFFLGISALANLLLILVMAGK